jgi:hypothetical protein
MKEDKTDEEANTIQVNTIPRFGHCVACNYAGCYAQVCDECGSDSGCVCVCVDKYEEGTSNWDSSDL